jgi:hypothetical protein
MIGILVDFSIDASSEDEQRSWLREIFTRGFRGFASMSTAELLRELSYRGLAGLEEPEVEEDDYEDEGDEPRIDNLVGVHRSPSFEDA